MGDHKSLCKWGRKRIGDDLDEVMAIVSHPAVVCGNCGRAVGDERFVCKPVALPQTGSLQPGAREPSGGGKAGNKRARKAATKVVKAEQRLAKAEHKLTKAQRKLAKARRKAPR